jgi:N6-adenosine-specific RNA methylase IME4
VATLPEAEQVEIVARGEKEILEAAKAVRARKAEARREARIEKTREIARANAALPVGDRKYSVIYADPPWSYEIRNGAGTDRAVENHYPTMALEELEALPVGSLAADDCALFVWAVMPQLPEALRLISTWGFEYKTCAFVWTKLTQDEDHRYATGMGNWTRANAEVCLIGTRGSPVRRNADVHQIVAAPRMEHSRKPDEVAARIERLVPGPYIELFARGQRDGWDVWGKQSAGVAA